MYKPGEFRVTYVSPEARQAAHPDMGEGAPPGSEGPPSEESSPGSEEPPSEEAPTPKKNLGVTLLKDGRSVLLNYEGISNKSDPDERRALEEAKKWELEKRTDVESVGYVDQGMSKECDYAGLGLRDFSCSQERLEELFGGDVDTQRWFCEGTGDNAESGGGDSCRPLCNSGTTEKAKKTIEGRVGSSGRSGGGKGGNPRGKSIFEAALKAARSAGTGDKVAVASELDPKSNDAGGSDDDAPAGAGRSEKAGSAPGKRAADAGRDGGKETAGAGPEDEDAASDAGDGDDPKKRGTGEGAGSARSASAGRVGEEMADAGADSAAGDGRAGDEEEATNADDGGTGGDDEVEADDDDGTGGEDGSDEEDAGAGPSRSGGGVAGAESGTANAGSDDETAGNAAGSGFAEPGVGSEGAESGALIEVAGAAPGITPGTKEGAGVEAASATNGPDGIGSKILSLLSDPFGMAENEPGGEEAAEIGAAAAGFREMGGSWYLTLGAGALLVAGVFVIRRAFWG